MTATEKLARELWDIYMTERNRYRVSSIAWDWESLSDAYKTVWLSVASHVLRREAKLNHSLRRCYTRLAVKPMRCGLDEGAMEEAERILRKAKR